MSLHVEVEMNMLKRNIAKTKWFVGLLVLFITSGCGKSDSGSPTVVGAGDGTTGGTYPNTYCSPGNTDPACSGANYQGYVPVATGSGYTNSAAIFAGSVYAGQQFDIDVDGFWSKQIGSNCTKIDEWGTRSGGVVISNNEGRRQGILVIITHPYSRGTILDIFLAANNKYKHTPIPYSGLIYLGFNIPSADGGGCGPWQLSWNLQPN